MTQQEEIERYKEIYKIRRKKNLEKYDTPEKLKKEIEWSVYNYADYDNMKPGSISILKPFENYEKDLQYEFIEIVEVLHAVEGISGSIETIVLYRKYIIISDIRDNIGIKYKYKTRLLSKEKHDMWQLLYDKGTLVYDYFRGLKYKFGKPCSPRDKRERQDQAVMLCFKNCGHNKVTINYFKSKFLDQKAKYISSLKWDYNSVRLEEHNWIVKFYGNLYNDYKKITQAKDKSVADYFEGFESTLVFFVECLLNGSLRNTESLLLLNAFIGNQLEIKEGNNSFFDFSNKIEIAKGLNKLEFLKLLKEVIKKTYNTSLDGKNGLTEGEKKKKSSSYPFADKITLSPQQVINATRNGF